jgi:hypothetical protein
MVDCPVMTTAADGALECGHPFVDAVVSALRAVYGHQLRSVAVFGSVARGTARPDSDLDLFILQDVAACSRARSRHCGSA